MQHLALSGCRPNQAPAEFRLLSSSGVGLRSDRFRWMAAFDPEQPLSFEESCRSTFDMRGSTRLGGEVLRKC